MPKYGSSRFRLGGTVALAQLLVEHLGLVLFTLLTVGIVGYLIYSMLRPERF